MTSIATMMSSLASQEGVNHTFLDGITIYKASESLPREPLCYNQGIIFVGQGSKRVYYGDEVYDYNEESYLVLSVPIPAECETLVQPEKPLLAMAVGLDVHVISNIIDQLGEEVLSEVVERNVKAKGLAVSQTNSELNSTVFHLLCVLQSPLEAKILGKQIVRELYFRILMGENRGSLVALAMKNSDLARIDKALKLLHSDYDRSIDVEGLASMVNMSVSTFHRTFREVTSTSPIQYLKKVRLTRARALLVEDGYRVNEAATEVGYESSAQFSREFKRYFGCSPVQYCNQNSQLKKYTV